METPDAALRSALAADAGRPLITQYDDRTGERVELSVATVDNWVSKTANLLQEAGVEPGSTAAVLLPAHWQTAAILLGCWRAGVAVGYSAVAGAASDADAEPQVVFTAADRVDEALKFGADEVWALSLAPLAAPLRSVPAGAADYAVEVRGQGDRFAPYAPVDAAGPGLLGAAGAAVSLAGLVALGADRAGALGLAAGGRMLIGTDEGNQPSPVDWLLAPLVVGASVVLLRHPDPARVDRVAADERVTVRA